MLSRRHAFIAVSALVLAACADQPPVPDTAALETWARRYVDLLNSKDEAALATHINRDASDAAKRISRYGGKQLAVRKFSTVSEFSRIYRVEMDVRTQDGEDVKLTEVAEWDGERWTMAPIEAPSRPPSAAATTR